MLENLGNIGGHEPFIVFKNKAILPEGKKKEERKGLVRLCLWFHLLQFPEEMNFTFA